MEFVSGTFLDEERRVKTLYNIFIFRCQQRRQNKLGRLSLASLFQFGHIFAFETGEERPRMLRLCRLQPCSQILDWAGKACRGQILKLILPHVCCVTNKVYDIDITWLIVINF